MLEFSIPDSPGTYRLNRLLISMIKDYPELFYDDFVITSAYGTFSGCTWNGGRDIFGIVSEKDCKSVLKFYNDHNISYRYTFTNRFLKKTDVYDRYCNMLLKINTKLNGVTYNKELIKDYIKKKYPSYYFVSSCTKNIKNIDEINKISKDELFVLDFRLNNKFFILQQLKHPYNIEVLVNEQCSSTCPYREIHYSMISKKNLFISDDDFDMNLSCNRKSGSYDMVIKTRSHYVSRENIINNYLPLGINKFKISGRHNTEPDFALMTYLDYFIKPKYREYFITICKENNII